ncbi:peptidoglycan DD-metalloendopeptidase family protein [Nonomuraea sp. NPDC049269]|uniref:M23 family metallopeptidase n=1 Tax=Nonomuraea sp. NPDC049269 TaxID=3364349 RepID=UPI0037150235
MPTPPTSDSLSPLTHLKPDPRPPRTNPKPDPPSLCIHPKSQPSPSCTHPKPHPLSPRTQPPSPRTHSPSPCTHPLSTCAHPKPQPPPPYTHPKPQPPFPFTHPSPNSPLPPTHQNSTISPYSSSGSTPTHPPPTNSHRRVAPPGPLTLLATLLAFAISLTPASPAAADRPTWRWPLDGHPRILRHFTPPPEPWLSGHRGIDLAAAPTTPVVAAGPGIVRFAGPLAGRGVVTVEHANGLRTTYLPVNASVRRDQHVSPGTRLGFIEHRMGHCQESCLHWGLLRGTHYLDPLLLLGRAHIRLLPYWNLDALDALDGTGSTGSTGSTGGSTGSPNGTGSPSRFDRNTLGGPNTLDNLEGPYSPDGPSDHNAFVLSPQPSLRNIGHLQTAPITAAPTATTSSTALPSTPARRSDPTPAPDPTPSGQTPERAAPKPTPRFVTRSASTPAISAISAGALLSAWLLFTLIRRIRCSRTQQHGAARGQHRKQQHKRRYLGLRSRSRQPRGRQRVRHN